MKAIFPGLPLLDAAGKELGDSQAGGDTQDAVQGFDALLALVAAQSATAAQLAQPVKPLAPSVGAQAQATVPSQGNAKAATSAPLELIAPQVDAAMYSIQGSLFASALDAAGAPLPTQLELTQLKDLPAQNVNVAPLPVQTSEAAPAADVAQTLPALDTASVAVQQPVALDAPIATPAAAAPVVSDAAPALTDATAVSTAPAMPAVVQPEATETAPVAAAPVVVAPIATPHAEATANVTPAPVSDDAPATLQPVVVEAPHAQPQTLQVAPQAPAAPATPMTGAVERSFEAVREPASTPVTTPVVAMPAPLPTGQVVSQPVASNTPAQPQQPAQVTTPAPAAQQPQIAQQPAEQLPAPVAAPVVSTQLPVQPPLEQTRSAPAQTSAQPAPVEVSAPHVAQVQNRVVQAPAAPAQPATSNVAPELISAPLQIHASVARAATHSSAAAPTAPVSEPETKPAAHDESTLIAQQLAPVGLPIAAAPAPAAPQQTSVAQASTAVSAPQPRAVDAAASLVGMRDAETGATVTSVEFFQAPTAPVAQRNAAPSVAQPAPVVTQPVVVTQPAVTAPAVSAPAVSAPAVSAPAPQLVAAAQAAQPTQPAQAAVSASSDRESAQPLSIEASPASSEVAPEQAPQAGAEELEANAQPTREESSPEHEDAAPEQQSQDGQSADAKPQAQQAAATPAFQPSDAHGMRGLDAIVASLLRTGAPDAETAPAAHSPARTASLELGRVETSKSDATKSAEKQSLESGALKERVLSREEERQSERDALQLEPAHPFHVEHKPDLQPNDVPVDAPPAPLPSPQLVQDPDAAGMGKLARGEGMNAAAITIDHPDFGAMDLVVESENGRIDVRAVLETPKAAAVMRAQESALRYGIQQAGMTFGALRVRSRGEEPTQLKGRDNAKSSRRPGHEWEA